MKGFKLKVAASMCMFAITMAMGSAQAQTQYRLNDNINFTLDDSGKLTVNSGYLTYYLLRGYDPKTEYQTGRHLVSASSQRIDFDVADLELDGFFPKVELKLPQRKYESTELELPKVLPTANGWQNAELTLKGVSLVGLVNEYYDNESMEGEDFADMVALLALNTLVVVDIAANTITGGSKNTTKNGGVTNKFDKDYSTFVLLNKFDDFAKSLRGMAVSKKLKDYSVYVDYAKVLREFAEIFLDATGINPADGSIVESFIYDSEIFFEAMNKFYDATSIIPDVKLRDSIKKQYQRLFKTEIEADRVDGDSLDALMKFGAKKLKEDMADKDSSHLDILFFKYMQPLSQGLAAYQKELRMMLIKAKGQPEVIKTLEEKIKCLNQARAVIMLSSILFDSKNIYNELRTEPAKFISTIFDIGKEASAIVIDEVYGGNDEATVLAKYTYQRLTGLDGRTHSFHVIRKMGKLADKGVSVGNSIANKLLPFLWDLAWAPGKMSVALVDGKLNPLGAMQSRVDIYRVANNGARELVKQLSNTNVIKDTVIALEHLEQLDIEVALSRPNMFDTTRSPWLMSGNVPPQSLNEAKIIDTNQRGYASRFLCTRTLLNDLKYVDYQMANTSMADAYDTRCGAGDWYANTWFNGTKSGATIYEDNDKLANSLKLKPELSDAQALISYQHIYREGDKPVLVLIDGHSTNAITHKISFVPAVSNVGFGTVQMPVDNGGYAIGFDVSQIVQSNLDPIVTYRWDFGDGSAVLETSSTLVEHVYAEGSFTVTLTVVTQAGIETTVSQTVAVGERLRTPMLEQPRYQIETDGSASIILNWRNIEQGSTVNLYLAEESFNDLNDIANYASLKGARRTSVKGAAEYRFTGLAADTAYFMVATTQGAHKESPLSNQVQLVTRNIARPTGKLNDTGIDWCADGSNNYLDCPVQGYEGQDAEYGRDALARSGQLQKVGGGAAGFDFTKLDNSGNPLPESASEWNCVRDNHTGLIWEIKQPVGSFGLRDANHTYSWYNPDYNTNGGDVGMQNGGNCQGSACDTQAFVNAVNAEGLCGASDWRLPSVNELLSIVHNGRYYPAIDQNYFPNTPSSSVYYWSFSSYAVHRGNAWVVVDNGVVSWFSKDSNYYVRLVRSGL